MKKLNRIAAAAMMLLVAVTSNAQVVQNEEQIYGRWRILRRVATAVWHSRCRKTKLMV